MPNSNSRDRRSRGERRDAAHRGVRERLRALRERVWNYQAEVAPVAEQLSITDTATVPAVPSESTQIPPNDVVNVGVLTLTAEEIANRYSSYPDPFYVTPARGTYNVRFETTLSPTYAPIQDRQSHEDAARRMHQQRMQQLYDQYLQEIAGVPKRPNKKVVKRNLPEWW